LWGLQIGNLSDPDVRGNGKTIRFFTVSSFPKKYDFFERKKQLISSVLIVGPPPPPRLGASHGSTGCMASVGKCWQNRSWQYMVMQCMVMVMVIWVLQVMAVRAAWQVSHGTCWQYGKRADPPSPGHPQPQGWRSQRSVCVRISP